MKKKESEVVYISYEQTVKIQALMIKKYGGLSGIKDKGRLESSLAMPMMACFGEESYPSLYDKAAAYLFFLALNHPFNDGNKRTAIETALVFLSVNGKDPKYVEKELEDFVVLVAQKKIDLSAISAYLEQICL